MPIKVSCQCGKRLVVKDEMAGKKGKCPACGQLLEIPVAEAEDELDLMPTEEEESSVPPTGGEAAAAATVCPNCGRVPAPSEMLCAVCGTSIHGLPDLPEKRVAKVALPEGSGLMVGVVCAVALAIAAVYFGISMVRASMARDRWYGTVRKKANSAKRLNADELKEAIRKAADEQGITIVGEIDVQIAAAKSEKKIRKLLTDKVQAEVHELRVQIKLEYEQTVCGMTRTHPVEVDATVIKEVIAPGQDEATKLLENMP